MYFYKKIRVDKVLSPIKTEKEIIAGDVLSLRLIMSEERNSSGSWLACDIEVFDENGIGITQLTQGRFLSFLRNLRYTEIPFE